MKTVTVRDLRQRWPETERSLQLEDELIITRDGQPVARLLRISPVGMKRRRWNKAAHALWQKKVCGGKISSSDEALSLSRADRPLEGLRR